MPWPSFLASTRHSTVASQAPETLGPNRPEPVRRQDASLHHDAVMLGWGVRTTIDLPDDLHKQALAIARDTHRTLSETVGVGSTTTISTDPRTGLPLVSVGTVVTSEDVRSLEDEG